jgi:hypothetical protein
MRCLDEGGGLMIYLGVDFHCSLLWFNEQWVIPWDLNPMDFRYMAWDDDGDAAIHVTPVDDFWSQVVAAPDGPIMGGSLEVAVIDLKSGVAKCVPLDYTQLVASSKDLGSISYEEATAQAAANPFIPPSQLWQVIGTDPGKWEVFFGWKNAHAWVGDPWVRRVHILRPEIKLGTSASTLLALLMSQVRSPA